MKNTKKESAFLRFLYNTGLGRIMLKAVSCRGVSRLVGAFMDSRASKPMIKRFVKKNGINLEDFYSEDFKCFNDCFTRKIKEGKRVVNTGKDVFIAPCDALLSAYRIDEGTHLNIKGVTYTVSELFQNEELAQRYSGGICLVFRLCVNHYHRYIYLDDCTKGENIFIKGRLHTVRPIALAAAPVFRENCREYTVMHTKGFGDVTQMEVGALLVGKIKNYHGAGEYSRGQEKGTFLYGGSTVTVFIENGRCEIDERYFKATENGEETDVLMGQPLGYKADKKDDA